MDIRSSLPYSTKYGEKELCELGGESGAIISFFANLDKNGSASPESYAKVTYEYPP
ncbi:MAG: hypothetical protein GX221_04355 [Candidatus Riflebacteria bacterium]|nr:hypothetical protein [Candidatus Riflebacteria bacterium]